MMKKTCKKLFYISIIMLFIVTTMAIAVSCTGGAKTCQITFVTNTTQTLDTVKVNEGETYVLPTPQNEGYEFEGWFLSDNFSGTKVTEVVADSDKTLYAKWTKLWTITLDADGGTLSQTTYKVKEGTNIYNIISDNIPSKSHYKFSTWYVGNTPLSNGKTITQDITLTAKYQVEYRVELYEESLDGTSYVKNENDLILYKNVGENVFFENDITGFYAVDNVNTIDDITLVDDYTKNVLVIYLDREEYNVTFNVNFPVGSKITSGENKTYTVKYGEDLDIENLNISAEGYWLNGWSTSKNGVKVYDANLGDIKIFNDKSGSISSSTDNLVVSTDASMILYAVWNKGYVDIFGGNDALYVLDEVEEGSVNIPIYMVRDNYIFKGTLNTETNSFTFKDEDKYTILQGKLFTNDTYVYKDESREDISYYRYDAGAGLSMNKLITLDAYNGITYRSGVSDYQGTYVFSNDGNMVVRFDDGELKGESTIMIGYITGEDGQQKSAFQVRNDEELNMGKIVKATVYNGDLTYYTNDLYALTLNGFGLGTINNGNGSASVYYSKNADGVYHIQYTSGEEYGYAKLISIKGKKAYMMYNSEFDSEFTNTNNDKLILDGMYNAKYEGNDGSSYEGLYVQTESAFGSIITIEKTTGDSKKFLITSQTVKQDVEKVDAEGNKSTVQEDVKIYDFELRANEYAEYNFKGSSSVFYAPLLVILDGTHAELYAYVEGNYVKVSVGTYENKGSRKVYTRTEQIATSTIMSTLGTKVSEEDEIVIDLTSVVSFDFDINTTLLEYDVNYWYQYVDGNDLEAVNDFTLEYKEEGYDKLNVDGTLELIPMSAMAIFNRKGEKVVGTYSISDGITTITAGSYSKYLQLDDEGFTFKLMEYMPYMSYKYDEGDYDEYEGLEFDGFGGVKYVIYENFENEKRLVDSFEGTVVDTGKKTLFDIGIYQFTSDEKTFKYIPLQMSNNIKIIAMFNNVWATGSESDALDSIIYRIGSEKLTLDGFGFYASYQENGETLKGQYTVISGKTIRFSGDNGKIMYFDLKDGALTLRGEEYGTYIVLENQRNTEIYLEFDGYGKLKAYSLSKDADGKIIKTDLGVGSYTLLEDGSYKAEYVNDSDTTVYYGKLSTYGQSKAFSVKKKVIENVYFNTLDWTILVLDNYGNASKYDSKGVKQEGKYVIITDDLLYYVNNAGTDANVYRYDVDKKTAVREVVIEEEKTYYSTNLESLRFTPYGFAVFNNETTYYYSYGKDDNIIIYRQYVEGEEIGEGESVNDYGFIEETWFGKFDKEAKEYKGTTYLPTSIPSISFERIGNVDEYPLHTNSQNVEEVSKLKRFTLTPSGSIEFTTQCSVEFEGSSLGASAYYLVRERNEDGELETYIRANFGGEYLRFDLKIVYEGEDEFGQAKATFEIVGMKDILFTYAYRYLYTYYMYYAFLGANYANSLENSFGSIEVVTPYKADGTTDKPYVNTEFLKDSGIIDSNGNVIDFGKNIESFEKDDNNLFKITKVAEDGYKYSLYFGFNQMQQLGAYGYLVISFVREQELTFEDYTVTVERILYAEVQGKTIGGFYSIDIKKNGENVNSVRFFERDGKIYLIDRVVDEETSKVVSSTYYVVSYKEKQISAIDQDIEDVVAPLSSLEISNIKVKAIYCSANENYYIDYCEDSDEIYGICFGENYFNAISSRYDKESGSYIVRMALNGATDYKITIVDGMFTYKALYAQNN